MKVRGGWRHYDDLPFEVVVETVDATHRELVSRHSVESEARHALMRAASAIVNAATHRVVVEKV
jgi:hypothetical protein